MGMFDIVAVPTVCPFCGEIVKTGQTKNLTQSLKYWNIGDYVFKENEQDNDDLGLPNDEIRAIYVCYNSLECIAHGMNELKDFSYSHGRGYFVDIKIKDGKLTSAYSYNEKYTKERDYVSTFSINDAVRLLSEKHSTYSEYSFEKLRQDDKNYIKRQFPKLYEELIVNSL